MTPLRGSTHFWVDTPRPHYHRQPEPNPPTPLAMSIVDFLRGQPGPVPVQVVTKQFHCSGERLRAVLDTVTYQFPIYQDDQQVGYLKEA